MTRLRKVLPLVAAAMIANTAWAGATPQASNGAKAAVVAGSYATQTGMSPRDSGCGDTNASLVLARLQEAKQTGATRIRCDLNWWTVQPTGPTSFNWSIYDNVVNSAHTAGLSVIFVPAFTPPWARPSPLPAGTVNPSHVPPVQTVDYTNFVAAAVSRYGPYGTQRPFGLKGFVRQWEIWNEPNLASFWNPTNATAYAVFLKASATAIKAADSGATVISGGMAPAIDGKGNFSATTGLNAMITTGAITKINGVGVHPYPFPAFASENVAANPMMTLVPKMAQALAAAGYPGKKIWATELGWPTASQSTRTIRSDGTQVGTESYQSMEMADILHTWFAGRSYAGPVVIFAQRDQCSDNTYWLCKMGLERSDGSHKPAYSAFYNELQKPLGS
jgi:hypothetical protein